MSIQEKIIQWKKELKIREQVTYDENKVIVGLFSISIEQNRDCLYVSSPIKTSKKHYNKSILSLVFLLCDEFAKEKKVSMIIFSPSVFNYFFQTSYSTFLTKYNFQMVTSDEKEFFQSVGLFQVNTFHWIKYLNFSVKQTYEEEQKRIRETYHFITEEIQIIKQKEPRTSVTTLGDNAFFHFQYRSTSINLEFQIHENVFYLVDNISKKRYSVNSKKEIQETIPEILNRSYNLHRTRFILTPPRDYFDKSFDFLSDEKKNTLYEFLRKTYSFDEIEDLCFLHPHISCYDHAKHSYFFLFNDFYYLFLQDKLFAYSLESSDKAKEHFESFILTQTKQQLDKGLSKIIVDS